MLDNNPYTCNKLNNNCECKFDLIKFTFANEDYRYFSHRKCTWSLFGNQFGWLGPCWVFCVCVCVFRLACIFGSPHFRPNWRTRSRNMEK